MWQENAWRHLFTDTSHIQDRGECEPCLGKEVNEGEKASDLEKKANLITFSSI